MYRALTFEDCVKASQAGGWVAMGAEVPVGGDAATYVDQYGESSSAQTIWSPELAEESQAPMMAEEDIFNG